MGWYHGGNRGSPWAMLNYETIGAPDLPGLMIAHGLFGSARNWRVIAKRLSDSYHVVTVDMRNHGASFWHDAHSYPDLARDLTAVMDHFDRPFHLLGHSMGGKSSMVAALTAPERIRSLIVADIAPVTYSHSQIQNIDAMKQVDLSQVTRRSEAQGQLDALGVGQVEQAFFTQSLDVAEKRWTFNLDALAQNMPQIMSFPDLGAAHYTGPALFLTGATSDYVQPEHRPQIRALFPQARFAKLTDAGHWLHAEQPRHFESAVRVFLKHVEQAEA